MGGLWGLTGMFISVPIFAILYMLIKLYIEKRLRTRALPTDTFEYYTDRENRVFAKDDGSGPSFAAQIKDSADNLSKQSPIKKLVTKLKSKDKSETDEK